MRGSPKHQVQTLYNESGIKMIGESKHEAKEEFRASLPNGKKASWHDIGQNTGIHSYKTADAYREVWITALKYSKANFGIKDIENLKGEHVSAFLMSKIEECVKYATFMQYAAALEKLAVALRMYAEKNLLEKTYDFSKHIKETRKIARKTLERFDDVRSYEKPEELIKNIENELYRLIASIQFTGGARIDEVYGIKPESLKDGDLVTVKGKGGKIRDIKILPEDYFKLKEILAKQVDFKFDKDKHRYVLRKAAIITGQKYNASHGLRWNFAQNRMKETQKDGKIYEQGLTIVSQEMGHERADITEHYLKFKKK